MSVIRRFLGLFLLMVTLAGTGQACFLDYFQSAMDTASTADDSNSGGGDDAANSGSINYDWVYQRKHLTFAAPMIFNFKTELAAVSTDNIFVRPKSIFPPVSIAKIIFISQAGLLPRSPSQV